MYHALHYLHEKHLRLPAGFIHIPASHELAMEKIPSWSKVDLVAAVKIIIKCLE
jgi:pyroglutamyl-peptidase